MQHPEDQMDARYQTVTADLRSYRYFFVTVSIFGLHS
jgi:hypothetical protein